MIASRPSASFRNGKSPWWALTTRFTGRDVRTDSVALPPTFAS